MSGFEDHIQQAEIALCEMDPELGIIIQNSPPFDSAPFKKQPFEALVHAIIAQQLSVKSASAIRQRVHALLPKNDPSAQAFSQITTADFKNAGMSLAKTNTVERLTDYALNNDNLFDQLHTLSDKDIKDRLCQIKGVGPWTVDIFLMFGLKRLDIFAPGDLGLRKAVKSLRSLNDLPTPTECGTIAKTWQPYRTVAAWHLWRTVD